MTSWVLCLLVTTQTPPIGPATPPYTSGWCPVKPLQVSLPSTGSYSSLSTLYSWSLASYVSSYTVMARVTGALVVLASAWEDFQCNNCCLRPLLSLERRKRKVVLHRLLLKLKI